MTNKEKELLLRDLCCRLPYGVMIHVEHDWYEDEVPPYDALLTVECHSILNNFSKNPLTCCFIIKPYLRPISSMTDEEDAEYQFLCGTCGYDTDHKQAERIIVWLEERHFDHRDLIQMGLALEAPEEMYN